LIQSRFSGNDSTRVIMNESSSSVTSPKFEEKYFDFKQ